MGLHCKDSVSVPGNYLQYSTSTSYHTPSVPLHISYLYRTKHIMCIRCIGSTRLKFFQAQGTTRYTNHRHVKTCITFFPLPACPRVLYPLRLNLACDVPADVEVIINEIVNKLRNNELMNIVKIPETGEMEMASKSHSSCSVRPRILFSVHFSESRRG